jgi:5-formyltetrahydrofolate cyclo-ligase
MDRPAIMAWRKAMRASLIDARMALPLEEHHAINAAVFGHVETTFGATLRTACVGIYWPFRRELDPLPFARRLMAEGATIALPVVVEKKAPMAFRAWKPGDKLAKGVWDIPYPAEGPFISPDALIVSLVGFDDAGFRLGYGGGYYDRTLAAAQERDAMPATIAVGFESARLETIHPLPHDIPLQAIVTETGVRQPRGWSGQPGKAPAQ